MSTLEVNRLSLVPLGAGDLIDRAVRLYRRHFATLIRVAAPPVVVQAAGSIMLGVGWRELVSMNSSLSALAHAALLAGGSLISFLGYLLYLVTVGGATRNIITHLLWNEQVSACTTFRNVKTRFWDLLLAAFVVTILLTFIFVIVFFFWYMALALVMVVALMIGMALPAAGVLVGLAAGIPVTIGALWLGFFAAGKLIYVPQVMMVEGRSAFSAIGRSMSLARRNTWRLMAITIFSSFATYSALMVLLIPLGVYGYTQGVDHFGQPPVWYEIGYNVVVQLSTTLLAPIWMIGLSLLYVDERVRHEGYDIELKAVQQLEKMPALEAGVAAVYTPALLDKAEREAMMQTKSAPAGSVLGLS